MNVMDDDYDAVVVGASLMSLLFILKMIIYLVDFSIYIYIYKVSA